jgi:hypothetical protein
VLRPVSAFLTLSFRSAWDLDLFDVLSVPIPAS